MNRGNTLRVIALSSAAWAFATAATLFSTRPGIVVICVGVAGTASVWIIARYTAERLKRELLAELDYGVHPHPRR
jgi:hypothetical protein